MLVGGCARGGIYCVRARDRGVKGGGVNRGGKKEGGRESRVKRGAERGVVKRKKGGGGGHQ